MQECACDSNCTFVMIVHVLDWQVLEQTATSSLYILVTHLYSWRHGDTPTLYIYESAYH